MMSLYFVLWYIFQAIWIYTWYFAKVLSMYAFFSCNYFGLSLKDREHASIALYKYFCLILFSSSEFMWHLELHFSLWYQTVISYVPVWIPNGAMSCLRTIIVFISGFPASITMPKIERYSIKGTEPYVFLW